jgi:hypothetical protein
MVKAGYWRITGIAMLYKTACFTGTSRLWLMSAALGPLIYRLSRSTQSWSEQVPLLSSGLVQRLRYS